MTLSVDEIKELVKRLRAFGVTTRGIMVGHVHDAAAALEALAGEVERVSALLQASRADEAHCIRERDRLKAALEAFVKHFGPLQDNAMLQGGE